MSNSGLNYSNSEVGIVETLKKHCNVTSLSEQTTICSGCKCKRRIEEFAMNLKTCIKCREKGKKMDSSKERLQKHKVRQKEMNAEYCQRYRDNLNSRRKSLEKS